MFNNKIQNDELNYFSRFSPRKKNKLKHIQSLIHESSSIQSRKKRKSINTSSVDDHKHNISNNSLIKIQEIEDQSEKQMILIIDEQDNEEVEQNDKLGQQQIKQKQSYKQKDNKSNIEQRNMNRYFSFGDKLPQSKSQHLSETSKSLFEQLFNQRDKRIFMKTNKKKKSIVSQTQKKSRLKQQWKKFLNKLNNDQQQSLFNKQQLVSYQENQQESSNHQKDQLNDHPLNNNNDLLINSSIQKEEQYLIQQQEEDSQQNIPEFYQINKIQKQQLIPMNKLFPQLHIPQNLKQQNIKSSQKLRQFLSQLPEEIIQSYIGIYQKLVEIEIKNQVRLDHQNKMIIIMQCLLLLTKQYMNPQDYIIQDINQQSYKKQTKTILMNQIILKGLVRRLAMSSL